MATELPSACARKVSQKLIAQIETICDALIAPASLFSISLSKKHGAIHAPVPRPHSDHGLPVLTLHIWP